MLLTITTTHQPATDLGFLLMKHPDNIHVSELPFGRATVVYPESSDVRCTAALLVEVDPIELVRGKQGRPGQQDQYVNDRPYAASSLLSAAITRMLGTAMSGRSKNRQELADEPLPFSATVSPVPVRGGRNLVERLFAPLGYAVEVTPIPLDPTRPEWGDSPYVCLSISAKVRLAALLSHLVVLIPVLDNAKHYFVGDDEVEKLLRRGDGWLDQHPERELIVHRFLKGFRSLVDAATARLDESVVPEPGEVTLTRDAGEEVYERPLRLNDIRLERVAAVLSAAGAASVIDLGCGEGRLLRLLLEDRAFTRIVGVEVSPSLLARAGDRLRLERLPDMLRKRIELLQGSLVYRDDRLMGFDAAAIIEVIEHIDVERLPALETAVFVHARPRTVVVTTPNADYNELFTGLTAGSLRHDDHRFEWTRAEFERWAQGVASRHGYEARFEGIGPQDAAHGAPTQMAIFTQC